MVNNQHMFKQALRLYSEGWRMYEDSIYPQKKYKLYEKEIYFEYREIPIKVTRILENICKHGVQAYVK